ncbi:Kinesin-like protein KIN-12A [Glycine soja]
MLLNFMMSMQLNLLDCGKTYTMWGPANCLSHENDQQGLAPRVFQQLFARISEEQTKHSENQLSYQCHCSFLEIYNEPIMDLLDPNQKNLQCWFLCARMEQGTYPPWAHGPGYVVSVDITRTMSKKFRHNHLKKLACNSLHSFVLIVYSLIHFNDIYFEISDDANLLADCGANNPVMKEFSDLDSWRSHFSMQLDHVLRDNAVLREPAKLGNHTGSHYVREKKETANG